MSIKINISKENKKLCILAAVILILVIATYSNHFHNSFQFDDFHTIVHNPFISDIRNIPLFFRDGTTFSSNPPNQVYRPLLSTTIAIDYFLGNGLDSTFFFHLHTFIFFIFQGFLMYLFFLKIFDHVDKAPVNRFIALIAVTWYMLHPANADTINYIIQRGESLSAFCIIFAFVLFMYSPFARKWCLYLLPFAAGAFIKPMAGIFAPLFFVYLLLFERKAVGMKKKKSGIKKKPAAEEVKIFDWGHFLKTALPVLIFVLTVMLFIRSMDSPTWTPGGTSFFNYVITQPYVILLYFATFFLPIRLSVDTDLFPFATMADIRFFCGTAFLILLIALAIISLRHKNYRPLAFGIFWFLIALLPTSLIPLAEVMNGHRMFLPFVGLTLGIVWSISLGIRKLARSMKSPNNVIHPTAALVAIVLLAYAYGTHQRNKVWRTPETLWKDVTVKSPNNGRGQLTYGTALMAREDFESAERYLRRASELAPNNPYVYVNMAILNNATGNNEQADMYFLRAIELGPRIPNINYSYANFLYDNGRLDEAEENLNRVIQFAPSFVFARQLLMDVYYENWNFRKLANIAKDTLRIFPNDEWALYYLDLTRSINPENLLHLSNNYYQSGNYERSIEAALEALKLSPDFTLAYVIISLAYAMLGEWDKAVEAGERALALDPDNQRVRQNLDMVKTRQADSLIRSGE